MQRRFARVEASGWPEMGEDSGSDSDSESELDTPPSLLRAARKRYADWDGERDVLHIERFFTELTERMREMLG